MAGAQQECGPPSGMWGACSLAGLKGFAIVLLMQYVKSALQFEVFCNLDSLIFSKLPNMKNVK